MNMTNKANEILCQNENKPGLFLFWHETWTVAFIVDRI